jgi:hypothetical protein
MEPDMTDRLKPFTDARAYLLNKLGELNQEVRDELKRVQEQVETTGKARVAAIGDMSGTADEVQALSEVIDLLKEVIKAEEEKPGVYDLEAALHRELMELLLRVSSGDRNAICTPRAAATAIRMLQRQGVGLQSWRKAPGVEA